MEGVFWLCYHVVQTRSRADVPPCYVRPYRCAFADQYCTFYKSAESARMCMHISKRTIGLLARREKASTRHWRCAMR
ncbi:unnamed protein product [Mesocestoides corti]|uniref:Secreted protein n=1 Tax=Mesocestoides corti TaxID=53468 RepID=A0A0R3U640_MESCO|nr:unnamed protein product [Mesocestoides corti]